MKELDLRGLACPGPVIQTRRALQEGERELRVTVDGETARENVTRMATALGCRVEYTSREEASVMLITAPEKIAAASHGAQRVFLLGTDAIGKGDETLGKTLMKAFLNTLAEMDDPPGTLLLMNAGVKLALEGADTLPALSNLVCLGTKVLVCGTCLDFFGVKDELAVGAVSNMYEIASVMMRAANTVTL
ncbi:MAG: sulfurtransferase-like selenium metabolism protein YedF [Candidatus Geothermincolia bacterium]